MRILHIVQRYHPAQGGAEIHVGELSRYLAGRGHDVTVATTDALDFELFWDPTRRRLPAGEFHHEGVRICRFPVRHLPWPGLSYAAVRRLLWLGSRLPGLPAAWLARLARLTPRVPELWRWLAATAEPFDLVAGMTITFEPLLAAGLAFARARQRPFVCYPLTHLGAGPRPGDDALSRFYTMRHQVEMVRQSDAVVAQTPAEKTYYVEQGLPPERIVVGGPGVHPAAVLGGDGDRFRAVYGCRNPIILAVGTMAYDKGTVQTVEAVRRLWQAGLAVELVLIGAVLAPFERYLAGLPAVERERLRLLGPVDDAVKKDALAAADIFCLPSRTDSFGIVYLEAWLYGKPVVAARTWGVMDLVQNGLNGRLVPFGDVPALADALAALLARPDEAAALGARGRESVYRSHTWDQKCALVADLYEQLAGEPRAGG